MNSRTLQSGVVISFYIINKKSSIMGACMMSNQNSHSSYLESDKETREQIIKVVLEVQDESPSSKVDCSKEDVLCNDQILKDILVYQVSMGKHKTSKRSRFSPSKGLKSRSARQNTKTAGMTLTSSDKSDNFSKEQTQSTQCSSGNLRNSSGPTSTLKSHGRQDAILEGLLECQSQESSIQDVTIQVPNESAQKMAPADGRVMRNVSQFSVSTLMDDQIACHNNGKYRGEWLRGRQHGTGKFEWADGTLYEGEWRAGKMHGEGKLVSPSGRMYEGTFIRGVEEGYGVCTDPSGFTYRGQWKDGKKSGFGLIKWSNEERYEGQWKNDMKDGEGHQKFQDGSEYKGLFSKDEMSGYGECRYPGHKIYKGQWKNSQKNGKGIMAWATGQKLEGNFENGRLHGKGTCYDKDGSKWVGQWSRGMRHGKFTQTKADGTEVVHEYFKDSKMVPSNKMRRSADNPTSIKMLKRYSN